MGILKDFFKAVKDNGPMIASVLRVKYAHKSMTDAERDAYDAIAKTATPDKATGEVQCTVPAGIADKDAQKALNVLALEYGREWKVVADREKPKPPANDTTPKPPQP